MRTAEFEFWVVSGEKIGFAGSSDRLGEKPAVDADVCAGNE